MSTSSSGKGGSVLLLIAIVVCAIYTGAYYSSERTVKVTVKSKERVETAYVVYGSLQEYVVSDMMLAGHWESSRVYGNIEAGKTYRCKVYGWRVGLLSMYPNIRSAAEIKANG